MKGQPQPKTAVLRHLLFSNHQPLLKLVILAATLFSGYQATAQSDGDFQTINSGKWNNPEIWQIWKEGSWQTADAFPTRNDGPILINKEHTVQVSETVVVDEVTVQGELLIDPDINWRISGGESTPDVLIQGKVENMGIISGRSASPGQMTVDAGGMLINQEGGAVNPRYLQLEFSKESIYEHARNAGTIPTANWSEGSTCLISGITDNNPANSDQTFGNLIWNCPGMIGNVNIGGDGPMIVQGIFQVQNTGEDNTGINIDQERLEVGEYRQNGGLLRLANSSDKNGMVVQNNFSMTGGILQLATNQATGTLSLNSHFNHTGGAITQAGDNATGVVEFAGDGSPIQNWTGGGSFEGVVNFRIVNGAAVTFGAPEFIDLGSSKGSFTNNGTLYGNFPEYDPEDGDLEGLILPGEGILRSSGTLAPGNSVGTLTIIGDLILSGTLSMEIEDAATYDRIIVTGDADLSGADLVADFGDFVPMVGNNFTAVSATTYTGTFASVAAVGNDFTVTIIDLGNGIFQVTSVLPVELLSFTGKRQGPTVELNWRTVQEINNDYMAVERADHSLQFEEIGRLPGAGTTTEVQDYQFVDRSPLSGVNYYRLRQVDIDGTAAYHEVIYVDFVDASQSRSLEVFPNPAPDRMRASWKKGTPENVTLRVFSTSGQLIKHYRVSGENATFELPLDGLAPGTYLLQLVGPNGEEVIRFVKQ